MVAIETESLTKQYGSVTAVRSLDLTVERGEVFGFLGPNGAGKSTTIDLLLGFAAPSDGTVRVLGRDPHAAPRAVRERVGVVAEGTGFYGRATARDHVRLAIEMQRADDDAEALLERVGIADAADRAVDGFSTGMRQRLALALALVNEPDLLVLDEPLAGLDPEGARRVRQVVREERDRGAAVFLSSHITGQVETLCDRLGVLHGGELVAVDTVAGLRERLDGRAEHVVVATAVPEGVDLSARDGVVRAARDEGRVRVRCADAAVTGPVVTDLTAAGATVTRVGPAGASLERLFVELTGGAAAESGPPESGPSRAADATTSVATEVPDP
ncbi:ABC transporter ATP-binding protein [Haloglomus salinum]|jgi:ABC-2 type transport system ATP-binding protein|uniref:ABC transporter ATP-binding protein n=1 Tax=Haloglomus salinum TaxID=2962673 RepID=UPI0020CA11A3|nr:ABC transporter ATP-binding protein [Haloglomus salinum]